jgi:AcrR family transcriptional regulator
MGAGAARAYHGTACLRGILSAALGRWDRSAPSPSDGRACVQEAHASLAGAPVCASVESMSDPARRPYTPRMTPRDRRRQLLDAALRIIIRDGYGAVSIETIAREADVSRPVIYGVFDGLGDLLGALLDRQERRALAQLGAALPGVPGDQDPVEFIVGVVRSMVEVVADDPDTWIPILLPPDRTPQAVRDRIDRDRERVRKQFEALLAWALTRRGRPADVDMELASHSMLVVVEHWGRLVLSDPERFTADRLAGFVEGLVGGLPRSDRGSA